MRRLFAIDPELGNEDCPVIIVGTNRMALLTYTALLQEGISVEAFCDLSGKNLGLEIMGKPVIDSGSVKQYGNAHLVYAGEDLQHAEKDLVLFEGMPVWIDRHAYGIVNDCVWSFM